MSGFPYRSRCLLYDMQLTDEQRAKMAASAARLADDWPPLTDEQMAGIAALVKPVHCGRSTVDSHRRTRAA